MWCKRFFYISVDVTSDVTYTYRQYENTVLAGFFQITVTSNEPVTQNITTIDGISYKLEFTTETVYYLTIQNEEEIGRVELEVGKTVTINENRRVSRPTQLEVRDYLIF